MGLNKAKKLKQTMKKISKLFINLIGFTLFIFMIVEEKAKLIFTNEKTNI
jgi:hypothetical protein